MSEAPTAEDDHGRQLGLDARLVLPYLGIVVLYAATVLGGLALTDEIAEMGIVLFEDPGDVGNVGVFAVIVLAGTGAMLLAFRYDRGTELVRASLLGSAGVATAVAFVAVTGVGSVATGPSLHAGLPTDPITATIALVTAAVLWVYPEWYVTDLAALAFGAAAIPMIGLGFGPLPIVVLLVVWAGYDAYAVYVSGHMEELAAGLGELRAPIVFVVPDSLSYSMRERGLEFGVDEADDVAHDADGTDGSDPPEGSDDEAGVRLLGLGDAVVPGMLAVSAGQYLDAPVVVPALNANLPAIGAVLGGVLGMLALLFVVDRVEGAHAGLPPLNAGVLGGYVVGAVAAGIPVVTALGI